MTASAPRTLAFAIGGPLERGDLPALYARVCGLLEAHSPQLVLCDAGGVEPSAVTADALARLQLAARRYGCQVRIRNASPELRGLLGFMGLGDVLPE